MTDGANPSFRLELARDPQALEAAQRLRYNVFVTELGADGPLVDHDAGLERDRFDTFFDHLLLWDDTRGIVAGVYRLLRPEAAREAGQYYSEDEYDLDPLKRSSRRILELGRSCLHRDYRGGTAMYHLWQGLAGYIKEHRINILFGVASFHGTDPKALAEPLSLLHHRHLAPPDLRPKVRSAHGTQMNLLPEDRIDRKAAMIQIPSLIKAYLRLGGLVGEGAFIDHVFNTIDVCLVMDTARLNPRHAGIYTAPQA